MATKRNGLLITLVSLLLGSAVIQTGEGIGKLPHKKYHVRVDNGLKRSQLAAHCKSADDDLKEQVLKPGEHFEWSFKINMFGTTLYYCYMWYAHGYKAFEAFNCTMDKFIYNYCGFERCHWKPTDQGITVFNSKKGEWELKYNWDKL